MPQLLRVGPPFVVAAVLLAGCSAALPGVPTSTASTESAQTQSQTEACFALLTALGPSALGDLASVLGDLSSDPAKALKPLKSFADNLKAAAATVTNPKVKTQANKLSTSLQNLITQVQKAIKNPKQATHLSDDIQKVRTQLTALGSLCVGL